MLGLHQIKPTYARKTCSIRRFMLSCALQIGVNQLIGNMNFNKFSRGVWMFLDNIDSSSMVFV